MRGCLWAKLHNVTCRSCCIQWRGVTIFAYMLGEAFVWLLIHKTFRVYATCLWLLWSFSLVYLSISTYPSATTPFLARSLWKIFDFNCRLWSEVAGWPSFAICCAFDNIWTGNGWCWVLGTHTLALCYHWRSSTSQKCFQCMILWFLPEYICHQEIFATELTMAITFKFFLLLKPLSV